MKEAAAVFFLLAVCTGVGAGVGAGLGGLTSFGLATLPGALLGGLIGAVAFFTVLMMTLACFPDADSSKRESEDNPYHRQPLNFQQQFVSGLNLNEYRAENLKDYEYNEDYNEISRKLLDLKKTVTTDDDSELEKLLENIKAGQPISEGAGSASNSYVDLSILDGILINEDESSEQSITPTGLSLSPS